MRFAEAASEREALEALRKGLDLTILEDAVQSEDWPYSEGDGWKRSCRLYARAGSDVAERLAATDWAKRLEPGDEGVTTFYAGGDYPEVEGWLYQLFEEIEEYWYNPADGRVELP